VSDLPALDVHVRRAATLALRGCFLIVLAIPLAASTAHGGQARKCRIDGGEVVPTAEVARGIAEAILLGRQGAEERAHYQLQVGPAGKDEWDAFEQIPPRIEANGSVTVTNGGGIDLHIDRCDGRVTFLNYVI